MRKRERWREKGKDRRKLKGPGEKMKERKEKAMIIIQLLLLHCDDAFSLSFNMRVCCQIKFIQRGVTLLHPRRHISVMHIWEEMHTWYSYACMLFCY